MAYLFYAGIVDSLNGVYKVFGFDTTTGTWTYILSPGPAIVSSYGLYSCLSRLPDGKTYLALSSDGSTNAPARVKTELGAGWGEITVNLPDIGGSSTYVKALKAISATQVFFMPYDRTDNGPNNGLFLWNGSTVTKIATMNNDGGSPCEARLVQGMDGEDENNIYLVGYVFNNTRGLWKWNGSTLSNSGSTITHGECCGVGTYGTDVYVLQTTEGDFPFESACCKLWKGTWGGSWSVIRDFTASYQKPDLNAVSVDKYTGDVWVLLKNATTGFRTCAFRYNGSTWTDWDLYATLPGSTPINPKGICAAGGKCMVTSSITSGISRVSLYYDGSSWSAKELAGVLGGEFPIPLAAESPPIGYEARQDETVTAYDEVRVTHLLSPCDQFDDGIQSLPTLPGTGSFTESGGNLIGTVNAGVNADWWTFGRYGILAYQPIQRPTGVNWLWAETELASLTIPTPSVSHAIWGLRVNDGNFVGIGFNATSLWVLGTTGYASWWSGGSTSITLPIRVRILWQPSSNVLYFERHTGTDWQRFYTLSSYSLQYEQVFFYNKNWSSFPEIISNWSYLCTWTLETEDLVHNSSNVLDSVTIPSSSVDVGQWNNPEVPQGLFTHLQGGGTYDEMEIPTSSVGTGRWEHSNIPEGVKLPDRLKPVGGGLNDDFFMTLGYAQYSSDENTTDSEGHPHLFDYRPYLLSYGTIEGEAWANPTANNFTGYAADGTRYTNGVQDAGPVYAPWYSEGVSNDRSSVGRFPPKYLIAVTRLELVIFDLANYPTNLDVWMRFRMGTSTSDTYKLIGRSPETLSRAQMVNGVLIVTTLENGTDRGRLHLIDFRQNDQRFVNLIGSDDHWIGVAGRDITDRDLSSNFTTSGVSPELRISPEYPYSMSAYSLPDGSKYWVVVAGEDTGPEVIEVNSSGVPQLSSGATGEVGSDNVGNVRQVYIDRDGWLWHSYYGKIYRNGLDYQQGYIPIPDTFDARHPVVDLGSTIWDLIDSENYIYAATDVGVFRINRGTLDARLIWTIAGGGGVGRNNIAGSGELLVGTNPKVIRVRAYTLNGAGYLAVASPLDGGNLHGGVTLIRSSDDVVLDGMAWPDLAEDGSYVGHAVGL